MQACSWVDLERREVRTVRRSGPRGKGLLGKGGGGMEPSSHTLGAQGGSVLRETCWVVLELEILLGGLGRSGR